MVCEVLISDMKKTKAGKGGRKLRNRRVIGGGFVPCVTVTLT